MTEQQAMELARALVINLETEISGLAKAELIEAVKEGLMCAYNDGWEIGFEEAKTTR